MSCSCWVIRNPTHWVWGSGTRKGDQVAARFNDLGTVGWHHHCSADLKGTFPKVEFWFTLFFSCSFPGWCNGSSYLPAIGISSVPPSTTNCSCLAQRHMAGRLCTSQTARQTSQQISSTTPAKNPQQKWRACNWWWCWSIYKLYAIILFMASPPALPMVWNWFQHASTWLNRTILKSYQSEFQRDTSQYSLTQGVSPHSYIELTCLGISSEPKGLHQQHSQHPGHQSILAGCSNCSSKTKKLRLEMSNIDKTWKKKLFKHKMRC